MNVLAIATPFSDAALHSEQIIERTWIVYEPDESAEVVRHRIKEHERTVHGD